jgi:Helix-turn-helix domain
MPLEGNFDLLTVKQVSAILHCSKAHVTNLAAGKVHGCSRLPVVRVGRRLLVRSQSFLEWIEQNEAANDNLKPSPERGRKRA